MATGVTLQSMTGFARADGHHGNHGWIWELRSVNGKGLDLRFRLPTGFEALEQAARKSAQERLNRGNIQVSLQLDRGAAKQVPVINEEAIEAILSASSKLGEKSDSALPTIADILAIRGVVNFEDTTMDESERSELETAML